MAHAIRNVGLEPFLVKATNEHILKSTAYAYLRGKVPVLLGLMLQDRSISASPVNIGKHAVAITGFSLGKNSPTPIRGTKFFLRASKMDKIYVHDDQVGPFAKMEIVSGAGATDNYLSTSWKGRDGKNGSVAAIPEILLVPLYHKIRIPFNVVHDSVFSLNDNVIEPLRAMGALTLPESLEWDIYLTTVNDFKTDIFAFGRLPAEKRHQTLTNSLPRFLWRATASCQGDLIIDLIFDATDIEQSPFLVYAVEYDCSFFSILKSFSTGPGLGFKERPEWKILEWFSKI